MPNDIRNLNDLSRSDAYQNLVNNPTPYPPVATLSTVPQPMGSMEMIRTYFSPASSVAGAGIGGLMAQGLQTAQSWNARDPYQVRGAPAGMAMPHLMTDPSLGIFRPGPLPRPPSLYSSPGTTGFFHTAADTASQFELMRTGMFADPNQAGQNYARMRVAQWGQQYGGAIGAGLGTVGGAAISGGGLMGMGATMGSAAGEWLGSHVGDIPVVGWAARKAVELSNIGLTEQLSWMGGSQAGTFGRVSMGRGDIGLGGRGMGAESSMRLGRQMRQMSTESGGVFNQVDMMNMLRTAGDAGFLESATNADQIAKVVGNLMKLVGHLGKVMGDPDFRNNIRELGNMRSMGFTINQALEALPEMNRMSRVSGMTRGQLMQQYGMPMAERAVASGLTSGVGMMAGMFGAGEARLLGGAFNETQKNLMGGEQGIAQRIGENQVAFTNMLAPHMVTALLGVENGQLKLNQGAIRDLMKPGAMDLTRLAGAGARNIHQVARQFAESNAAAQGRQVTSGDMSSAVVEIMSHMKEFQSELVQTIGPKGVQLAQFNIIEEERKKHGDFNAAMLMAGGDPYQAQIFMKQWRDPKYRERVQAQAEEEERRLRGDATLGAMGRAGARQESIDEWGITRGWRNFWQRLQQPSDLSDASMRQANEATRQIQREGYALQGIAGVAVAGTESAVSPHIVSRMQRAMEEGKFTAQAFGVKPGDAVTEPEFEAYERRLGRGSGFFERNWGQRSMDRYLLSGLGAGGEGTGPGAKLRDEIRASAKKADTAGRAIAVASKMTDQEYRTASRNLYEALGGENLRGNQGAVMASIKAKLATYAAGRGQNNQGIEGMGELRSIVASALKDQGMSPERAEEMVFSKNVDFWNTWMSKTLSESADPNVRKAMQATSDEALLLKNFGITERGEKGIEQARTGLMEYLTQTGAIEGIAETEAFPMGEGGSVEMPTGRILSRKELSREEEAAFGMLQKVGSEGNMTRQEEGQRRALMMLAARAMGPVSKEQERASALVEDIANRSGRESDVLAEVKAELKGFAGTEEGRKTLSTLSGIGRAYEKETGVDWATQSPEEILKRISEGDIAAEAGRNKLGILYAPAAAQAQAKREGATISGKPRETKTGTEPEPKLDESAKMNLQSSKIMQDAVIKFSDKVDRMGPR